MKVIKSIGNKTIFGISIIVISTSVLAFIGTIDTVLDFMDRLGLTKEKILAMTPFIVSFIHFLLPVTVTWLFFHCYSLNKQIKENKAFIDNWIRSKGDIDKENSIYTSTTTRVLVSYLNGLFDKEDIINIASSLLGYHVPVSNCEKIGLKDEIILLMKATIAEEQMNEHTSKLNDLYPTEDVEPKKEVE